jgi:hypothetical protein
MSGQVERFDPEPNPVLDLINASSSQRHIEHEAD